MKKPHRLRETRGNGFQSTVDYEKLRGSTRSIHAGPCGPSIHALRVDHVENPCMGRAVHARMGLSRARMRAWIWAVRSRPSRMLLRAATPLLPPLASATLDFVPSLIERISFI